MMRFRREDLMVVVVDNVGAGVLFVRSEETVLNQIVQLR